MKVIQSAAAEVQYISGIDTELQCSAEYALRPCKLLVKVDFSMISVSPKCHVFSSKEENRFNDGTES